MNILLLTLFLLLGCNSGNDKTNQDIYFEYGEASWYGPGFQGEKTANGDEFDMGKLTAAHKTLEFGTFVRVTNLSNQKQVFVKINDRGPYVGNRIIDLSKKAAEEIDMVNSGHVRVKIEVIDPKKVIEFFTKR